MLKTIAYRILANRQIYCTNDKMARQRLDKRTLNV